jgi:hypothetical protein
VIHPVAQSPPFQRLDGPLPADARRQPLVDQRKLHVLIGRELVEQVELLKDESDLPAANESQLVFGIIGDILSVQPVYALVGGIQTPNDVHERGFSASRGSTTATNSRSPIEKDTPLRA